MIRSASCLLFLSGAAIAVAQVRIDPPSYAEPASTDIRVAGNMIHQTVTCRDGEAVYVQGQENHVEVQGSCRFVRVQGNRNLVYVDRATTVPVEGNENRIVLRDPKTKVSERGERNTFTLGKGGFVPLDR